MGTTASPLTTPPTAPGEAPSGGPPSHTTTNNNPDVPGSELSRGSIPSSRQPSVGARYSRLGCPCHHAHIRLPESAADQSELLHRLCKSATLAGFALSRRSRS